MTDNELAVDWAFQKTQNDMLRFEITWLRVSHRRTLHAACILFCALVLQTVILIWCVTR